MSTSYRRSSMAQLYDSLKSQEDDEAMDWLDLIAETQFPSEEKTISPYPLVAHSPASYVSSGSSSAASSNSPSPNDVSSDSDGDISDSGSDSNSEVESIAHPEPAYTIHNGYAYPTDVLERGGFLDIPYMPDSPASGSCDVICPSEITETVRSPPPVPPSLSVPTPVTALPSPARSSKKFTSYSLFYAGRDSDQDADGESDGNASDDEYVPSPSLNPSKRTFTSRSSSPILCPPLPSSLSISSKPHTSKRKRTSPPSRNIQKREIPTPLQRPTPGRAGKYSEFTCPDCGWVQRNKRTPDFKRHLRTHTRPSDQEPDKGWWCKGVLLEDAAMYKIPADAQPYLFLNKLRVGGCVKTFSRRDALKRHLDNHNVECVGKPVAATEE